MISASLKIIFYDGECGLCQRSISFLSRADRHHQLLFAPLNGETYRKYFREPAAMETVLYYVDGKVWNKSTAIIECASSLGGLFWFSRILKIIPRFIRDWAYDLVARHRKKVSCPILLKDNRFLH